MKKNKGYIVSESDIAIAKLLRNGFRAHYVFGVALHSAKKGEPVEILLGTKTLPEKNKDLKGKYWMVNSRGEVVTAPRSGLKYEPRKEFGNCFPSKKLAERAAKRMRTTFSRLKK